ncbi:Hypothetical predicted protein [Pelobates cultripes]|uniref:Uncharacterized protein n=1 Tax=Pelobates cultripes TaxID=61616 RepID=A0AAD1SMQ9_PELCU|nr:Hypothetical predicted protein [Pelobates cultripes]
MDAIYGHRPANQGKEGGLDSASALLESMIESVDTVDGLSNDTSTFSYVSDDGPSTSFSSTRTMTSTPTQPQSDRRRFQLDLRTVMEDMRAAEERQQERMENLSERRFQALRQDAHKVQHVF